MRYSASKMHIGILLRKTRRIRDKMIDFYGLFSVDAAYVFTGMAAVTLISLIIAIISICKTSSMKKKYKEFMGGSDGTSIEELIKGNLEDVNQIKKLSIKNENNMKNWNIHSRRLALLSMMHSMKWAENSVLHYVCLIS